MCDFKHSLLDQYFSRFMTERCGLSEEQARFSAYNGRGPWWNAKALHMRIVIPNRLLLDYGLLCLVNEHRRFTSLT